MENNQLEQTAATLPAAADRNIYTGTFKVKVHDLHSEDRFEYVVPTMNDAINLYKQIVSAGRNVEPRPFVYLDDAQWLALIKFSGGLVRQVWVAETETGIVRGHNAGMRRREQLAQNPVALPPSIVPAAKPVATGIPAPTAQVEANDVAPVATEAVPF